jgi:hypothetical protein
MSEEEDAKLSHAQPVTQHINITTGNNNQLQVGYDASGSQSMSAWREQHVIVKRAEVAGAALKIALRYLDVMRQQASGVRLKTRDDNRTSAEVLEQQWSAIIPLDNEFNDTIYEVRIHLGDDFAEVLKRYGLAGQG